MSEENKEEVKNEQPAELPTLEEVRNKLAVKMLITYYPDNQEIVVENVQNLTRPVAAYAMHRILKTYDSDDIATSVVMKLASVTADAKKNERIWVPGSKK